MKKKIIVTSLIILLSIIAALSAVVFIPLWSARQGTVKTSDGMYHRFNALSSIPGLLILKGSPKGYDNRENALNESDTVSSLFFISSDTVDIIDYTIPAAAAAQSFSGKSDGWNIKFKDYIGEYQINAAGNNGFLFLYARGNSVYGTVRFPSWGKGLQEPLKNLRIGNGTISFTRSAVTTQELTRLGITTPFTQEYSGSYLHSGKTIKGTYSVLGVKKNWDAERK